jgi:hypothetical protein
MSRNKSCSSRRCGRFIATVSRLVGSFGESGGEIFFFWAIRVSQIQRHKTIFSIETFTSRVFAFRLPTNGGFEMVMRYFSSSLFFFFVFPDVSIQRLLLVQDTHLHMLIEDTRPGRAPIVSLRARIIHAGIA